MVMILDNRETGGKNTSGGRNHFKDGFQNEGIRVVSRSLPVGDIAWVVGRKNKSGVVEERMVNWIIERKTEADIVASCTDGRYKEQKSRLLWVSGIDNIILLIEEGGSKIMIQSDVVFGAFVNTQLITGFHCMRTTSSDHRGELSMTYEEWNLKAKKAAMMNKAACWALQLRMVPGCGREAVAALVALYPTPLTLSNALTQCPDNAQFLKELKESWFKILEERFVSRNRDDVDEYLGLHDLRKIPDRKGFKVPLNNKTLIILRNLYQDEELDN
eukprot:GHVL01020647.1.p1 GENE.GHVL01020647.1~~GHVL01020647.1.p1  ORF type:complete len:302 (-),score=73.89 GHVL01020647.1:1031-1849(-)